MAISLDDIQFLDLMIQHSEAGVQLAQGYLDTSSPAQRQSRIADLARNVVESQGQAAADMRSWLQQAGIELPTDDEPNDDGIGDEPGGCSCGGM
ncbi:DUF305 domain-containing protein [Streptomyces sp. NPDC001276]|uniref:DUF305 domain-containing protein n=1 Tax=Streptomyces sp. NPDC001276 TaxID=3364555 RepID=UPI0036C7F453